MTPCCTADAGTACCMPWTPRRFPAPVSSPQAQLPASYPPPPLPPTHPTPPTHTHTHTHTGLCSLLSQSTLLEELDVGACDRLSPACLALAVPAEAPLARLLMPRSGACCDEAVVFAADRRVVRAAVPAACLGSGGRGCGPTV